MKVAIIGSFQVGKTTLSEEINQSLKNFSFYPEAYNSLEEDGYEFNHPPELNDYEEMINRSCEDIIDSTENAVFDRCPLDYLALACASESLNWSDLPFDLDRIKEVLESIDMILYIPIESPDRIAKNLSDFDREFRTEADKKVRELLFDDPLDITQNINMVEIMGPLKERVRSSLDLIREG